MTQITHISCACCFGAKVLTADGKSSIPCPICEGGKIEGSLLQIKNLDYLKSVKIRDEEEELDDPYYDNNEY